MQTRVAFNSGEFTPEMDCRSDLEQYQRGCRVLENWQVGQIGSIKRRRGMRKLGEALSSESRLIPYVYSYADAEKVRYLVELAADKLRVLDMSGVEQVVFESGVEGLDFNYKPGHYRYYQQNKLLFITSLENAPMVLEFDGVNKWEFKKWEFKHHPWGSYNEPNKEEVVLKSYLDSFSAEFPDDVDESDRVESADDGDFFRLSYWREQEEVPCKLREVLGIVKNNDGDDFIFVRVLTSLPTILSRGEMFAVAGEKTVKYWVCKAEWQTSNFVEGLESPANYPNSFAPAEDIEGFDETTTYYSLKQFIKGKTSIAKGTKIAITEQYWEYFTCIRDFSKDKLADDFTDSGVEAFKSLPAYFIYGIPVGNAVPCRGKWSFYCSGVWFGAYEVRRNYDDGELSSNWEGRGISFSRNDAASNTSISGTEQDEECWLRLFLTKSRKLVEDDAGSTGLISGFPPDGCSNRLIVERYKHDVVMKLHKPGILKQGSKKNIHLRLYLTDDNPYRGYAIFNFVAPDGTKESIDVESFGPTKFAQAINKKSKYFTATVAYAASEAIVSIATKMRGEAANAATVLLPPVKASGDPINLNPNTGKELASIYFQVEATETEEEVDFSFSREGEVLIPLPSRIASSDWSWSAFSNRNGYPLLCCVFQQRLVFGSTKMQPLTVWFSRVDDIDNFLRGDVDDAAITLTLSAPSQNPICWMQPQDDRLMLGTSAMEYSIISSSQNLVFSSTSARARVHSYVGSDGTPAIAVTSKAVFVERGASRVYEYGWNEESGGYMPRELSIFAPHIGTNHDGFVYPTLMTKPDVALVWTLGDGQLAICTYNSLQEVRAWHRWVTDGKILSACAMPNGREEDSLYLIVERDNGVNVEVVDKDSPYVDADGRDYDSTIITNPLFFSIQERVGRRNDNSFWIRFGSPFEYEPGAMVVSIDGGDVWREPDWLPDTVSGWKEAKSDATWQYEKQAGIKVHGNRGCHILGLQG